MKQTLYVLQNLEIVQRQNMIEKKLIKEYEKYNLYGIYKNKKLLYKTCESNIKDCYKKGEIK